MNREGLPAKTRRYTGVLLAGLLVIAPAACSSADGPGEVGVVALKKVMDTDSAAVVVDVRTKPEIVQVRAAGIDHWIPVGEFEKRLGELPADKKTRLYLICRSGARSMRAARIMHKHGYKNVFNVAGGTNAWIKAGYPTESGLFGAAKAPTPVESAPPSKDST